MRKTDAKYITYTDMGYETNYTITITAEKNRRLELAKEILVCANRPFTLNSIKEYFDGIILTFNSKSWDWLLMDINGKWWHNDGTQPIGARLSLRGIGLRNGEKLDILAEGEDDTDVRWIIAEPGKAVIHRADVTFVDRDPECPNTEEDDDGNKASCSGCRGCAKRVSSFEQVHVDATLRYY